MNENENKEYAKAFQELLEVQKREHEKNKSRIKWGLRCVILVPMIFLILMFTMDSSQSVYLVLWIVSMFIISGYLIYVEYMDFEIQKTLIKAGISEDEVDQLLPENIIEEQIQGIKNYVGEMDDDIFEEDD